MNTEVLLKDPVFQLNLLLWMAKEQPKSGYRVRPFFYELGFEIIYIEQPFAFTEDVIQTIKGSTLEVSIKPEPDLILGRKRDNRALYFEAKASSFGIDSKNSKQARAHLFASGPVFGDVFSPLNACLLCYVVPEDKRDLMTQCLAALVHELRKNSLKPGPFSAHGLAKNKTSIDYHWDLNFKNHVGVTNDVISVLDDNEEDTNPAPLILVFSDEDCGNIEMRDFYRQVVMDQVRACLLCDLHALDLGKCYETSPDNILVKTTNGIFDYLGRERQKRLCRLVRENIFKKIADYWKDKQVGVILTGNQLNITWNVIGEKDDFLDWLEDRRTRFDSGRSTISQPTLFDEIETDTIGD